MSAPNTLAYAYSPHPNISAAHRNRNQQFSRHTLNEDQEALVDIVVNTINSKDKHIVEYTPTNGVLSSKATNLFLPGFMTGDIAPHMPLILEKNGGLPKWLLINECGYGTTTPMKSGSYSLIFDGGEHKNGRAVTTGHEIFGHGRSYATGLGDEFQHVQAIRTENLILRVMGIPFVNTGINHGKERTPVTNPTMLPAFR